MSAGTDHIYEAAMQLSQEDRVALIARLLDATPEEQLGAALDDPDFIGELDRRSQDREGEVAWTDLRAER
jgi:hypothetical protein